MGIDIHKEREAFDKWHYEQYLLENPNIDIANAKYIYDYAHNNALVYQLRESHFTAWQAAKAQAVPEGFVLIEKKSLRDTYYWDGCEYVVDHPSEYEMELERGEITTLEKWQRTKETKVYCANIYSNEDDFEVVQFETAEEAEKAVAENKAMIEAQEPAND